MERSYLAYIDCLNRRDWAALAEHVAPDVEHNGRSLGTAGYRRMLEENCAAIPDLRFAVDLLVCEGAHVAAVLAFDCRPRGRFLELQVDGRRVGFAEHAFYIYRDGRIARVRSLIDREAIRAQLDPPLRDGVATSAVRP